MHFAGSDDIVLASDIQGYTGSASNPVHPTYGYWLQIPALAGGVAVAHNQKDGAGNPLNLSTGTLNLSRKAVCGIVSGHITKWNNPILTALNGGVPYGTGQITFVHRSDGSGTSFLFSNAMVAQCAGIFGPNNEGDPTLALYNFPWTDKTLAASQCPAIPVQGANQHNYPDASPNQCGVAVATPAGSAFANGSGNSGVVAQIHAINGAIGYATPDFVDPVVPIGTNPADGLPVAAIENQYDIDNFTGQFQKPTFDKASIAMSSSAPVFDSTSRKNPLNWSRQLVQPNPLLKDAYPIAGFTMLNLYQCYSSQAVYDGLLAYANFHFGSSVAKDILHSKQFSEVPGVWYDEIVKLLNPDDPVTGLNKGGTGACAGKSGA
ncbi:MAG: phosphatase [Bradyrhizobium icense]|nr:MAG: phosphatase [Bradyrhizobium icense]